MARRYSGQVTVECTYLDSNVYECRVSTPSETIDVEVGPPAAGYGPGVAYDSPEAYDQVARAALSFADDEEPDAGVGDLAAYDVEGSGWHVGRSKADAWPTEPGGAEEGDGYTRKDFTRETTRDAGEEYPPHTHCVFFWGTEEVHRTSSDAGHTHEVRWKAGAPKVMPADDGHDHGVTERVCHTLAEEARRRRSSAGPKRGEHHLPGATKKEDRQYEHIYQSSRARGYSVARSKQIAAATVNKQRSERGETRSREECGECAAEKRRGYRVEVLKAGPEDEGGVWVTEGYFHSRKAAEDFASEYFETHRHLTGARKAWKVRIMEYQSTGAFEADEDDY